MAHAIASGKKPRANIDLAGHIVEVMQALEQSAISGAAIEIKSHPSSPDLVPKDFNPWSKVH
jgi:hypothetical protein